MTKARQLRIFWKVLVNLLDRGYSLVQSLQQIVIIQGENNRFRNDIWGMTELLIAGNCTFAEAMETLPDLFSLVEIDLIRAGEIGGVLEISAKYIIENKGILTKANQYRVFWNDLATLINSEVPLLRVLRRAGMVFDEKSPQREAIRTIIECLKKGHSFGYAFKQSGVFSDLEVDLIYTGDQSGKIETALFQIAELC